MLDDYSYGVAIPYGFIAKTLPFLVALQAVLIGLMNVLTSLAILAAVYLGVLWTIEPTSTILQLKEYMLLMWKYNPHIWSAGTTAAVCYYFILTPENRKNLVPHLVQSLSKMFRLRYSGMVKNIHLPRGGCSDGKIVPSISFLGGGHLWSFALGMAHHMWRNYDMTEAKFLASSCGCFGAVPLALGLDPYVWAGSDWQKCIDHYNSRHWLLTMLNLGSMGDTKHFYYGLWDDYLPEDAHITCSGRLFLSTTKYPSLKSCVISEFESREQLIWAIVGSICLPVGFIGDFPVDVPGHGPVIDGGFSNDAPCLDTYTVTVSALHNQADCSPHILPTEILGDTYCADPLTFVDIIRTPCFERVWQIAKIGEQAAAHCKSFGRAEWVSLRKKRAGAVGPGASTRKRAASRTASRSRGKSKSA